MSNKLVLLKEIELQNDDINTKINEYKKVLNENLRVNKKGYEEEFVDNSIVSMDIMKENLTEIIHLENTTN